MALRPDRARRRKLDGDQLPELDATTQTHNRVVAAVPSRHRRRAKARGLLGPAACRGLLAASAVPASRRRVTTHGELASRSQGSGRHSHPTPARGGRHTYTVVRLPVRAVSTRQKACNALGRANRRASQPRSPPVQPNSPALLARSKRSSRTSKSVGGANSKNIQVQTHPKTVEQFSRAQASLPPVANASAWLRAETPTQ